MRKLVAVAVLMFAMVGIGEAGRGRGGSGSRGSRASSGTGSKASSTSVRGYTTKRGTYVAPARRTTADGTQRNNFGTKGNTNPYTGKAGTRNANR